MKARILLHTDSRTSNIHPFELPAYDAGQVEIAALCSGISLGTEKKVALGQIPPDVYESMKVPYQIGQFDGPIGYGYSLVGQVTKGPADWLGKRVHLMHPHQDRCVVKTTSITCIPDVMSEEKATLISNMETAINGLWDGQPTAEEHILVCGFGLIGALLAGVIFSETGHRPVIAEKNPQRINIAQNLGFEVIDLSKTQQKFDLVYNTTGQGGVLNQAFGLMTIEGRLVEMSWYGNEPVNLVLGTFFHRNRLKLISSQVSEIPVRMKPRWNYEKRKQKAIQLLQNDYFDRLPLKAVSFLNAPMLFDKIRSNQATELGYYLKYK